MVLSDPVPSINIAPSINANRPLDSPINVSSSSSSIVEEPQLAANQTLERPKAPSRKSSGTMIVPRDSEKIELREDEEEYDDDDVRCMSPKRSPEDVERLGEEARNNLMEQARQLQASLLAIVDKVECCKEEHDKLEGGNKFLQQYIGELIQTTKITSTSKQKAGRK